MTCYGKCNCCDRHGGEYDRLKHRALRVLRFAAKLTPDSDNHPAKPCKTPEQTIEESDADIGEAVHFDRGERRSRKVIGAVDDQHQTHADPNVCGIDVGSKNTPSGTPKTPPIKKGSISRQLN